MNKIIKYTYMGGLSLALGLLAGCAPYSSLTPDKPLSAAQYQNVMRAKINENKAYAAQELKPDFKRAGVSYPPKQIVILVFKNTKVMELWARGNGPWEHIKNYQILAASGHAGPKLRNNDHQVPEGIYRIDDLNPVSRFHLSMELSYPNAFDRMHARLDGRTDLGGEIFIHGSDRSIGCMAIGDKNIDQLFVLADMVGVGHIEVIVAPNDLRHSPAIYYPGDPKWTPQLYANIKQALAPFHG